MQTPITENELFIVVNESADASSPLTPEIIAGIKPTSSGLSETVINATPGNGLFGQFVEE